MASVLIDTETYKITLRIVEDFINSDFENFLKNGYDSKSKKIITWEMLIYCKMLDNKIIGYTNYYLFQLKKLIKERLNENLYLEVDERELQIENFYIKTHTTNKYKYKCDSEFYFITPEVQICKNPALIKISFYCYETKYLPVPSMFIKNEILKQYGDLRKISYISQLKNLFVLIINNIDDSEYVHFRGCGIDLIDRIIKYSKYHKRKKF